MFHKSEFEEINTHFLKLIKEKNQKNAKIWLTILLGFIFTLGILFLIKPDILSTEPFNYLVPIYGGILFVILLVGFLVSKNIPSESPSFNYLYDEVYKKINYEEEKSLVYTPYLKEKFTFHKIGGLYTRGASVKVKRHVSGYANSMNKFDIYDCTMITSNGNSSTTHFNGVYFRVDVPTTSYLQVRTTSSPKLKGHKYDRIKDIEDLRVYVDEKSQLMAFDYQVINYVRKIKEMTNIRQVAISIIPGEIHLGITYKLHPARKQKNLTYNQLNSIYQYFISELQLIDETIDITSF